MVDDNRKDNYDLMCIQGRGSGIFAIIVICGLALTSITFIAFVWMDSVYLKIGLIFLAFTLLCVIPFLFAPCWILFSGGTVRELTFLNKVRKEKNLDDLKEVLILTLWNGRLSFDYYCLAFVNPMPWKNYNRYAELLEEENLIIFHYSKRSTKILEKYVSVPAKDMRK